MYGPGSAYFGASCHRSPVLVFDDASASTGPSGAPPPEALMTRAATGRVRECRDARYERAAARFAARVMLERRLSLAEALGEVPEEGLEPPTRGL